MRAVELRRVSLVDVVNAVAERVGGAAQLPGEHARAIRRVGDRRRIIAPGPRRSVYADQAVLGPRLPIIVRVVLEAGDAGEKPFGARTEASSLDRTAGHVDKVLSSRKDKSVSRIVITRDAARGLAVDSGHAQIPPQPERPVAVACAIDKAQLGLKTVAAGGQRNRNREIAGSGVQ